MKDYIIAEENLIAYPNTKLPEKIELVHGDFILLGTNLKKEDLPYDITLMHGSILIQNVCMFWKYKKNCDHYDDCFRCIQHNEQKTCLNAPITCNKCFYYKKCSEFQKILQTIKENEIENNKEICHE